MIIKLRFYFYLVFLLISSANLSIAQVPTVSFQSIATGLSSPVDIVNAGDGSNRLFFVERTGTIRIYQNGALISKPFLNVSSLIIDSYVEQGLLSLAFHPDYKNNRYFFIYYTNLSGSITVARYTTSVADPNVADSLSGVILLTIPKPYQNHNGGKLNFGPDGDLYFGTGDGGSGGNPENTAQSLSSLLGKMLRINVDNFSTSPYYTVPADNPFVNTAGALGEIWDLGLRNPWRWSFDKQTGDMWVGDVGQAKYEEIDFRKAGQTGGLNFGWRCYEGDSVYNSSGCGVISNYVFPVFTYAHNAAGGIAVVGGYVYRGTEFPSLQGYYICGDYSSDNGWLIKPDGSGGWNVTEQMDFPSPVSSFGQAENADLYVAGLNGTIYKINSSIILPLKLLSFTVTKQDNNILFKWVTANEINTKRFELESSNDGINFSSTLTKVSAKNQSLNTYTFPYSNVSRSLDNYYRLKIYDNGGSFTLSSIVKLNIDGSQLISPVIIEDHVLHIYSAENIKAIEVLTSSGSTVVKKQFNSGQSYIEFHLPEYLSKGVYIVKLLDNNVIKAEKIIIK